MVPLNVVEHSTLRLGDELGEGGQGSVHRVLNRWVDNRFPAAYKEYLPELLTQLDDAVLRTLAGVLDGLPDDERDWLLERTAWPMDLVARQGRVCGFLMRIVPDELIFTAPSLDGSRAGKPRAAQAELLLNPDDYVAGLGLSGSERDRLALLGDLAETLRRLHALGVAVGDLSPKNVLFDPRGAGRCFLIDCDAMAVRGAAVLPQVETPDWTLPAGEPSGTPEGDVFKFGLLAARLFSRDQSSTDVDALASAAPDLGELARRSVLDDPSARPTAAEWIEPIEAERRVASVAPAERTIVLPGPLPPPAGPTTRFTPGLGVATAPARPAGRSRGPAIAATVSIAVVLLAIIISVLARSSGSGAAAGSGNTVGDGSGGVITSTTDSGNGPTDSGNSPTQGSQAEQTELQAFVQYLTDSTNARSQIVNAVNGVDGCSENPGDGVSTMQQAAQTRNNDASSVKQLPVDAIPDGTALQNALASLLTDSATADNDYAGWMQDMQGQSCPFNDQGDSNYQAAVSASKTADADKTNFVSLWNADVSGTSLPTYTATQL